MASFLDTTPMPAAARRVNLRVHYALVAGLSVIHKKAIVLTFVAFYCMTVTLNDGSLFCGSFYRVVNHNLVINLSFMRESFYFIL